MLWPTGVLQDEIDVAVNKPVSFLELDRRGSSCPTLFAWNGEKYEFITDVIGAGVIGHWISPTSKNTPDPDEWVKIDGSKLRAKDGYLSVRFGEPMEEVNYIDQLRMVAVDHPADVDVYPDERFLDNPPFASGKTVATSAPHPPSGAWDNQGRDVLQLVSARDHQYVRDFTNLPYAGFANTHSLTLDLGTWTPQNPLRLFLSGFIEYFSATSMYAAWQAGLQPISPYIEAQMPDGSWKRVVDDMGFPAGLPRTITVDLTGKLPRGRAEHSHHHQSADLLGPGAGGQRSRARERSAHHRVAAGCCDAGIPRLSAAGGRRNAGRPDLLLRSRPARPDRSRASAEATRTTAT